MIVEVIDFFPEELKTKKDQETYQVKGTCAVLLSVNGLSMEIRNITYRVDHEGKIILKPPFRIHSNKKAGIKPKLVPSIIFKNPEIWPSIEVLIRKEIPKSSVKKQTQAFKQLDLFLI